MRWGSTASLPNFDHRRTPALPPGSLVVRHVEESGKTACDYDFGELPVGEPLRRALAELFAKRCGPDGEWRQLPSSREVWGHLTRFARFLEKQNEPVNDVEDISAAVWAAWRLSRPSNQSGSKQISKVQGLLREHPGLPAETRELMVRRAVFHGEVGENAYAPEDFDRIKALASRKFRAALLRIRENVEFLERWRAGEFQKSSKEWKAGAALDYMARTGDVELYVGTDGRVKPRSRHTLPLGGTTAEATWKRLFLDSEEGAALLVLMIATYGWNVTTASELVLPTAAPDAGADGRTIWRVELQKRRRHIPNRYETRNLADWGADSPGRLISQAVEATAPARAALAAVRTPMDELVLWKPGQRGRYGLFRTGMSLRNIEPWRDELGFTVNCRRLRKTVVIGKRTPIQHSEEVHDSVYVLGDPRTAAEAAEVIEAGIAEAVTVAQTAFAAKVSRCDVEADADTATASCTDYTASPFTEFGSPCRASFLLCTGCPNAVVTPRHLPRLAYLLHALTDLSGVLPAAVWEADWRDHHRRLSELRGRPEFTDTEWADALAQVTQADRELIDTLLNRGLDS